MSKRKIHLSSTNPNRAFIPNKHWVNVPRCAIGYGIDGYDDVHTYRYFELTEDFSKVTCKSCIKFHTNAPYWFEKMKKSLEDAIRDAQEMQYKLTGILIKVHPWKF